MPQNPPFEWLMLQFSKAHTSGWLRRVLARVIFFGHYIVALKSLSCFLHFVGNSIVFLCLGRGRGRRMQQLKNDTQERLKIESDGG